MVGLGETGGGGGLLFGSWGLSESMGVLPALGPSGVSISVEVASVEGEGNTPSTEGGGERGDWMSSWESLGLMVDCRDSV